MSGLCLRVQKYSFGQTSTCTPNYLPLVGIHNLSSFFICNSLSIRNVSSWAIFTPAGWTQPNPNTRMLNSARNPQSSTSPHGIHSGLGIQTNIKHAGNTVQYYSLEGTNAYLLKCLQNFLRPNKVEFHLTPVGLNLRSAAESRFQKQMNFLTAIDIMIAS